jgi:hypothetical protein
MASDSDISLAKQELSGRLLGAGLTRGRSAPAPAFAMAVASAVEQAGSNTHAVGVGLKLVDGNETDIRCIRVHVLQKIAASLLSAHNRIPSQIDGIPTDVIEAAPAMLQARRARTAGASPAASAAISAAAADAALPPRKNMRAQQRPAVGGLSAAHFEVTAGTIACFCCSTKAGDDPATKYLLSNNHVFANLNRAKVGDAIYQPGPIDGGTAAAAIAKLHRFVELNLDGNAPNAIDAAIAELASEIAFDDEVHGIGAITGTSDAKISMKVRKQGRTSGYTEGQITDLEYDAIVRMDHQDASLKGVFHGQIRIVPGSSYRAIALGGDSGSLVVDLSSQNAVGLYFAGPQGGEYGIANPIVNVLKELEIAIG